MQYLAVAAGATLAGARALLQARLAGWFAESRRRPSAEDARPMSEKHSG